jgi:gliding motility-associated-like protein
MLLKYFKLEILLIFLFPLIVFGQYSSPTVQTITYVQNFNSDSVMTTFPAGIQGFRSPALANWNYNTLSGTTLSNAAIGTIAYDSTSLVNNLISTSTSITSIDPISTSSIPGRSQKLSFRFTNRYIGLATHINTIGKTGLVLKYDISLLEQSTNQNDEVAMLVDYSIGTIPGFTTISGSYYNTTGKVRGNNQQFVINLPAVLENRSSVQIRIIGFPTKQQITSRVTSAIDNLSISAAYIPVDSIRVTPAITSVTVGSTTQLSVNVFPNATNASIYWNSSNPTVASVSGTGLVTGISVGNATISASVINTNTSNIGFAQVTVNPLVVTIPSSPLVPNTQFGSKLVDTTAVLNSNQGFSVSLSSDGKTALVGGYGIEGVTAWVYTFNGSNYGQLGSKLVSTGAVGSSSSFQRSSVSLSSDGKTALVGVSGDNNEGAVWIYTFNGSNFVQFGNKLVGTGAQSGASQGISVSISSDGKTALVGGSNDSNGVGAAWIYTFNGINFVQAGNKLVGTGAIGNSFQGSSVSLSSDGKTALVGGTGDNSSEGAVWIYTFNGNNFVQAGNKLVGFDSYFGSTQGSSVSLSSDGKTALVGGSNDFNGVGAVWVYTFNGNNFVQLGNKLVVKDYLYSSAFGSSVSLSSDGKTALVGGSNDNNSVGAVWVYTFNGNNFVQAGNKLVGTGAVGSSSQGTSVSLSSDGKTALVGGNNDNSSQGAVWVFTATGVNNPNLISQTITGLPTSIRLIKGNTFTLTGLSSSGLPLTYAVGNASLVSIQNNVLSALGVGSTTLIATQNGNTQFAAADPAVVTITITPQEINSFSIIGKQQIPVNNLIEYKALPEVSGYKYVWNMTGITHFFIPDSLRSKVRVLCTADEAKNGTISLKVFNSDSVQVYFEVLTVVLNESSLASTLKPVDCNQIQSNSSENYISEFSFGEIVNKSTSNSSGYSDYTGSDKVDTLIMGLNYSLNLKANGNASKYYFALWIDYNGDGSFEDAGTDNFVDASLDGLNTYTKNNIIIKNSDEYEGPKRLRVSMRTSSEFKASEYCGTGLLPGETEDYLIFLKKQDELDAPDFISPNNDGKNDLFLIKGIDPNQTNRLIIFDRWGEVKYTKDGYLNDWSGTDLKGEKLDQQTYFYIFKNGSKTIKGFFELRL